jgi:AcrR family transcriptional regulator
MSISNAQSRAPKKRSYRLGKRADQQRETRQRIVEAAVELHSSIGPARTTVAQIAERAGVQRHTYYAHFPDERGLFLACSELALGRDPLPDVAAWRSLAPGKERLCRGLADLYRWYGRNDALAGCVLRDAAEHELTREIVDLRMTPVFDGARTILGEGLTPRSNALLAVALDFGCWRALSATYDAPRAAQLMSDAIFALA